MFESVKRFFGFGGSSPQEERAGAEQHAGDAGSTAQRRRQQQRQAAAAAAASPAAPPLLAEAVDGGGGVQGLDWFQLSMRRDSDGDCAHTFLEEPCRQQQQRRRQQEHEQQQQQQQQQREGGGSGPQPSVSPEGRPAAKQQRGAVLQDSSRSTRPAGPSQMIVHDGNVIVVPDD